MKIFFLLFVLSSALLTGCSTNYNYPSKKITVHKISGAETDYELLSVRGDTAIVVLNWDEADIIPIPYSHAEVLKNVPGIKILRSGHDGGGPALAGAALGAIAGGIISGVFLTKPPPPPCYGAFCFNIPDFTNAGIIFGGIAAGAIIGGVTANFLPPSLELHIYSKKDVAFLRSISAYPDKEPDEMQYIK